MSREINVEPHLLIAAATTIRERGELIGQLSSKKHPAAVAMTERDWGKFAAIGHDYLANRETNDMEISSLKIEAIQRLADPIRQSGEDINNQDKILAEMLGDQADDEPTSTIPQ